MSSVVAKLQAKLAARKTAASPASLALSQASPAVSLLPTNAQQAIGSLESTVYLMYRKYQFTESSVGFTVGQVLQQVTGNEYLKSYCTLEYPDVCMCGNVIADTGSVLRLHCPKCKRLAYPGYRREPISTGFLHRLTGIHTSWLEFALAKAIYRSHTNG